MYPESGPWRVFRRHTALGSNEERAAIARVREDGLEVAEGKHVFRYGWTWFLAAFLVLLPITQWGVYPRVAYDHPEVVFGAAAVLFGIGTYRLHPTAIADPEDRIAATPEPELFDGSHVRIPLEEATRVRQSTPLLGFRYTGIRFEYNGNEYFLVGAEAVIERLLAAFRDAGSAGGDGAASSSDGTSAGEGPVTKDAVNRK